MKVLLLSVSVILIVTCKEIEGAEEGVAAISKILDELKQYEGKRDMISKSMDREYKSRSMNSFLGTLLGKRTWECVEKGGTCEYSFQCCLNYMCQERTAERYPFECDDENALYCCKRSFK